MLRLATGETSMFDHNTHSSADNKPQHTAHGGPALYTREAFRALLARQPEGKIRSALEEGNIPSSNIAHAVEWLDEQERQRAGYLM
jgi:hypothetical protein